MGGSTPAGELLTSELLVGRAGELHAIRAVFAAPSDVGDVLLMSGEPGIGKSSLVAEAVAQARTAGWTVHHAAADELDADRVYWLVGALFRDLRGELRRSRSSGLPSAIEFAISPRIDAADAVAAHVEQLRVAGPVLVAIDDVQWADAESIYAITALVRRATSLGVVILVAFRPEPMSAELSQLVDVARGGGATELVLEPLGDADVEQLAHRRLEGPISANLRSHLAAAGGNPWLVNELVAHAQAGGLSEPPSRRDSTAQVPPSVADAVRRRLRSVTDDVAGLLRVAAVLGKTFSVEEVAQVASESMGRVAIAMAHAAEAGFLCDDGDTMSFRHDLFRQALEGELPRPVRRALHREAASVLHAAGASRSRIAPHLVLGARRGDAEAFAWLVDSAEEASLLAPSAAADLLAHAAQVCREDDPRRVRTEVLRARLLVWGGRPHAAEQLAADLLRGEPDARLAADLHGIRARALFLLGRPAEAIDVINRLAEPDASGARDNDALGLAENALARLFGSDLSGAAACAEQALAHATAEPASTSLSHSVLGWTTSLAGRLAEAREHADAAIELATEPAAYRYVPHLFSAIVLNAAGDAPGARLALRSGRSIGMRIDVGWARAMFDWADATVAFLAGDWSDALTLGEAGDVAAQESGLQLGALWPVSINALVAARRGETQLARLALERADGLVQGGGVQLGFDWWAWAHAVVDIETGAPDRAATLLHGALRVAEQTGARSVVNLIGIDLVKAAIASDDRPAAERAAHSLGALASTSGVASHQGLAEHAAGLVSLDRERLDRGIAHLDGGHRPYELGRVLADAALLHARSGDAETARRHAKRAIGLFDGLGASVDDGRLREELRGLGVVVRGAAPLTRSSTGWDSLTKSERAVVDLVARGLSNGEVAERLFVSRRTVESHLLHVYAKVGSRSRVELARQAADRARG